MSIAAVALNSSNRLSQSPNATSNSTPPADVFVSAGEPMVSTQRVATPGTFRGLTEPLRRYIPGHDERHSRRQSLHQQIFAAVEVSKRGPSDAALAAWKDVVAGCKANKTNLTAQLKRCSDTQHVLEDLLEAADYDSLGYLRPHLDANMTYGKVAILNNYIGEWKYLAGRRVAHGKGRCTYADTTRQGHWADNELHGQGTKVDKDGRLTGNFVKGELDGMGRYETPAYTYEGGIKGVYRNGRGAVAYAFGDVVTADWKMGNPSNLTICFKSGGFYEGDAVLEEGRYLPNGAGRLTTTRGAIYEGAFQRGKLHGAGTYTFGPDSDMLGYQYVGGFVNDNAAGPGVLRNIATGESTFCFYHEGELVTVKPPTLDLRK